MESFDDITYENLGEGSLISFILDGKIKKQIKIYNKQPTLDLPYKSVCMFVSCYGFDAEVKNFSIDFENNKFNLEYEEITP